VNNQNHFSKNPDLQRSKRWKLGRWLFVFYLSCQVCCGFKPAQFVDRPPVQEIGDDEAIDVPEPQHFVESVYFSDGYLRKPLINALDPHRIPYAKDINSFDEVPRSSWFGRFSGPSKPGSRGAVEDGPPISPFTLLPYNPTSGFGGLAIEDARGIKYELRRDSPARPELQTSAAVIASRLIRYFGLLTPEVWITSVRPIHFLKPVDKPKDARLIRERVQAFLDSGPPAVDGEYRVSATRWPLGFDVGITDDEGTRSGDPNDRIEHQHRRSLRSLKVIGSWLGIANIGVKKTRDAYIGEPGLGHLLHYIVGMEEALGAGSLVGARKKEGLHDDLGGSFLENLITFGFYPPPETIPTQTKFPAIGEFPIKFSPLDYKASLPYSPIDYALPSDGYWAAKTIANIPDTVLWDAVWNAHLTQEEVRIKLYILLQLRRRKIIKTWFDQVSPIEVVQTQWRYLTVKDEAVVQQVAPKEKQSYRVTIYDSTGKRVKKPLLVKSDHAQFRIHVPDGKPGDTMVVQVKAQRIPKADPTRIYVKIVDSRLRVIAIRH
jgi:hypothetical protein